MLRGTTMFWLPYNLEENPVACSLVQSISLALRAVDFGNSPWSLFAVQEQAPRNLRLPVLGHPPDRNETEWLGDKSKLCRGANKTVAVTNLDIGVVKSGASATGTRGVLIDPYGDYHSI